MFLHASCPRATDQLSDQKEIQYSGKYSFPQGGINLYQMCPCVCFIFFNKYENYMPPEVGDTTSKGR